MRVAFRTGGFVGMTTVGLGLLGASLVVLLYKSDAPSVLEGFGFGAALLAMFMRVGGGIFTKAADVGADLVGKVEQNIPEDDPRNAATIADNVGDNVGDCAGMAADLFESYAVMLVAALILGKAAFGYRGPRLPADRAGDRRPHRDHRRLHHQAARRRGRSDAPSTGRSTSPPPSRAVLARRRVRSTCRAASRSSPATRRREHGGEPAADRDRRRCCIGIVLAAIILALTGYFTGTEHRPVKDVGKTSLTGAATVILSGLSVGFESAVYTALVIAAAVYGAFLLGGGAVVVSLFAVALAGCGLLTTVGVIVAMDTFGPVSDNAQGIAEMSGDVDEEGAAILTELDAVGNTTKAITKGIAIATAVLAATALFGSFTDAVRPRVDGCRACRRSVADVSCIDCSSLDPPTWSVCSSVPRSCSCSPAWRSTPSAAPPAPWSTRCVASSARSRGSWRAPVVRSTARSSTSAPATRCASWPPRVCWRSWRRSRSASGSASDRWPATWPARSPPAP